MLERKEDTEKCRERLRHSQTLCNQSTIYGVRLVEDGILARKQHSSSNSRHRVCRERVRQAIRNHQPYPPNNIRNWHRQALRTSNGFRVGPSCVCSSTISVDWMMPGRPSDLSTMKLCFHQHLPPNCIQHTHTRIATNYIARATLTRNDGGFCV